MPHPIITTAIRCALAAIAAYALLRHVDLAVWVTGLVGALIGFGIGDAIGVRRERERHHQAVTNLFELFSKIPDPDTEKLHRIVKARQAGEISFDETVDAICRL